jgi:signal transduction histidine kinase
LKLQEVTRRAESAERSEREKLEVLAMIAHELGNPLTVALGNMQVAARYLDAEDISMIRRLVAESKDALESLAHLTGQIIAASRGDDLALVIEPINLSEPLKIVQTWAAKAASEKSLNLEFRLPEGPLLVHADKDAVLSILNNLLTNAIRYTPTGGSVAVSCGTDPAAAWVRVSDTGIGISFEEQEHIFDKFFRSEEAKNLESHGLGMGLNIAHRLATAQQGNLTVESAPGKGSRFTLRLPLVE